MGGQGSDFNLAESVEQARRAGGAALDNWLFHPSQEVLEAVLENPRLSEQHLLVLLSRRDLRREILARVAQNREWMSSYAMKLAVLRHPRTPRHLALPLIKFIYLFDLLAVALTPGLPTELKRLAEDAILSQKEGLALGQRIALARRGSLRVAAGLLGDRERAVIEAALSNPSLTEQAVVSALLPEKSLPELADAVMKHSRWSFRHGVKLALVRSPHLSLARLLEILPELSSEELADLVSDRRVQKNIRAYAARTIQRRGNRGHQRGAKAL